MKKYLMMAAYNAVDIESNHSIGPVDYNLFATTLEGP
jgi:hypothetical protein